MKKDIDILEKVNGFNGFFRIEKFRLRHSLFAGGMSQPLYRELLDRGQTVAVLPYDPLRDEVVLIEQFRIGALQAKGGAWLWEIVAGIVETGESRDAVAYRETMEETGCHVRELLPVTGFLVSPGSCSEWMELYCAWVDATAVEKICGVAEEGEDIRVFSVSYEEAMRALQDGRINSAAPMIALQWLALNRDSLRRRWLGEEA
jgi:ADP-ribose pyrophosphatase